MKGIELLSPARDVDAGIAAVNCGADAVYIGADRYGARKAASNEFRHIERLIAHAHLYRTKVYLALNTVLDDRELDDATRMVHQAWNLGIDGLIIQDMGLLACDLPPVPLIASTQTDNRSIDKVLFLERAGFSRVILARELSLKEISSIREQTTIELEAFVHGALCVSYSGQCWISQAVTGRSANRGECSQMCRSAYDLVDANGKIWVRNRHLLSLKDLNLGAYLRDMIDAGVGSFKIEGRLKDTSYVKNITAYYRNLLDTIIGSEHALEKTSSGSCSFTFIPDPEKTFNRGYTTHFIEGRKKGLSSLLSQKSLGKKIGTVTGSDALSIFIQATETVHNGDGLCFFDEGEELQGFLVNKAEPGRLWPGEMRQLQKGTELYRNLDRQFINQLEREYGIRKIGVNLHFRETKEGFMLAVTDEDGFHAELAIQAEKLPAKNEARAAEAVKEMLLKTGNTPYHAVNTEVEWSRPWFLLASVVNGMRRKLLDSLDSERKAGYLRKERLPAARQNLFPLKELSYRANIMNERSATFYRDHGVAVIEKAFEMIEPSGEPVVMNTRYCLKYELGRCPIKQEQQAESPMKEPLWLVDGTNRYRLSFDCRNCEMNVHLCRD